MTVFARLRRLLAAKRRQTLSVWWIFLNVVYEIVRAFVVTTLFASHGVNGLYYLAFCLFFSVFFGYYSFKLVLAFVDSKPQKMVRYGILTGLTFFAPDIYILIASHDVPNMLFVTLAGYLLLTTTATVYSLRKKVHKTRTVKDTSSDDTAVV